MSKPLGALALVLLLIPFAAGAGSGVARPDDPGTGRLIAEQGNRALLEIRRESTRLHYSRNLAELRRAHPDA